MRPTFSVIIPVYNVENYLTECINSLLQQKASDIEILLIDDGSTDSSPAICDAFGTRDKRLKVIHKSNGGVSSARNEGLRQATGSYITFVDSDDFVSQDYFETLRKALAYEADLYHFRNLEYVSRTKQYLIEDKLPSGMHHNLDEIDKAVVEHRFCLVWDKIYRKDMIDQYKLSFDCSIRSGEDFVFNIDYLMHVNKVYVMKEYPYRHRSNPESVRYNPKLSHIDDLILVYERAKKFIADKKAYQSYDYSLKEAMLWILSYSLIPGLVTQRIGSAAIKSRIMKNMLFHDLVSNKYNTYDCRIFRLLLMHHLYSLLSGYRFCRLKLVKLFRKNKIIQME